MDLVVNRLSEIEAASVRILEEAAVQNKELDDASKKPCRNLTLTLTGKPRKNWRAFGPAWIWKRKKSWKLFRLTRKRPLRRPPLTLRQTTNGWPMKFSKD